MIARELRRRFAIIVTMVAAVGSPGFARADFDNEFTGGLAVVRLQDIPRVEQTRPDGRNYRAYEFKANDDGSWTVAFNIVHWFRRPLAMAKRAADAAPDAAVFTLPAHDRWGLQPQSQIPPLTDKYFLMEVNYKDKKLQAVQMWDMPKLPEIEKPKS